MKLAISSVLFALPLALIACGGDDGGVTLIDGGDFDAASGGPDACVAAKPTATEGQLLHKDGMIGHFRVEGGTSEHHACDATADYGAATAGMQAAGGDLPACATTNPDDLFIDATLNADAMPDIFELQLYKGYGAFATGEIRTGTFQITGDETTFADCGVCALIFANIDTGTGMQTQSYLAQSGTVTITSVSPNLTGTVSNLQFIHVDIANGASTPNADNCPSAITSLAFDAAVMF